MEHAHAVGAGEAAGEADAEFEEFLPGDGAFEFAEALAADVLADDVEAALELADAVHRHDVGVLDAGGGAGFGEEAFTGFGAGVDDVQELDRHGAVEDEVVAEEDHAHAAAAEHPDDPVLIELLWQRPLRAGHGADISIHMGTGPRVLNSILWPT